MFPTGLQIRVPALERFQYIKMFPRGSNPITDLHKIVESGTRLNQLKIFFMRNPSRTREGCLRSASTNHQVKISTFIKLFMSLICGFKHSTFSSQFETCWCHSLCLVDRAMEKIPIQILVATGLFVNI